MVPRKKVLEFPPRASFNKPVKTEELYGITSTSCSADFERLETTVSFFFFFLSIRLIPKVSTLLESHSEQISIFNIIK